MVSRSLLQQCLSCHDDLVNGQDCAGSLSGKLNSPLLGDEEIEDTLILGIKGASVIVTNLNIDTNIPLFTVGVSSVQPAQNLSSVESSTLRNSARHNLKGLTVLLDGVLAKTRGLLTMGLYSLDELNLCSTGTRHQPRVAGDSLNNIDTVIDSTLDVVEVVLGSTSEDEGGCSGSLVFLAEYWGGTNHTADSSKFELAENSNAQDAKAVQIMHGQIAHSLTANNDTKTGIIKLLDGGLKLRLLTLCEIHHLLGVVQENSALCLGLSGIDRAGENTDLGVAGLLDRTIRLLREDHTLNNPALLKTSTHDLDDTDIVHVEVGGVLGENGKDSLGNKIGKESLVSVLLAGDNSADGLAELLLVAHIFHLINSELLEGLESKLLGLLILSFSEQLSSKDDDQVGGITHLGFLLLTGHDKELSGGVDDVEFAEDCGSVRG
ncbi:hypothetical protein HG530_003379 [Fusarium avenaceum]|nr:hypothetical protein HG530_003379 [Fusarium avenaceum]